MSKRTRLVIQFCELCRRITSIMNVEIHVCGRKPSQPVSRRDVSAIGADDRSRSNEMLDHVSRSASPRFECERLRSYETGLVATRRNGTSCSTTPVGISSAHQTQTRNVKTVRHDQRLTRTAPTAHTITCLAVCWPYQASRWFHSAENPVRSQTRPYCYM